MVASHSSSSSTSNKNTANGKTKCARKDGERPASKAEVSEEKKLFSKSVRTPCTLAMFKKFLESAPFFRHMENNTLKLVGPTHSTGERDFS